MQPLLNSIKDIAPEKFRIVYPNSGEAYANGGLVLVLVFHSMLVFFAPLR